MKSMAQGMLDITLLKVNTSHLEAARPPSSLCLFPWWSSPPAPLCCRSVWVCSHLPHQVQPQQPCQAWQVRLPQQPGHRPGLLHWCSTSSSPPLEAKAHDGRGSPVARSQLPRLHPATAIQTPGAAWALGPPLCVTPRHCQSPGWPRWTVGQCPGMSCHSQATLASPRRALILGGSSSWSLEWRSSKGRTEKPPRRVIATHGQGAGPRMGHRGASEALSLRTLAGTKRCPSLCQCRSRPASSAAHYEWPRPVQCPDLGHCSPSVSLGPCCGCWLGPHAWAWRPSWENQTAWSRPLHMPSTSSDQAGPSHVLRVQALSSLSMNDY